MILGLLWAFSKILNHHPEMWRIYGISLITTQVAVEHVWELEEWDGVLPDLCVGLPLPEVFPKGQFLELSVEQYVAYGSKQDMGRAGHRFNRHFSPQKMAPTFIFVWTGSLGLKKMLFSHLGDKLTAEVWHQAPFTL